MDSAPTIATTEQVRLWLDMAADALNEVDVHHEQVTDPADLAHLLADVRDLRKQVGEVYARLETHLLAHMDEKRKEVGGLGVVEAKRKTKRTAWRHDELVPVVVARALDERRLDEETGEYEREAEAVARVLRDCISLGAGKITGLRARGITPDEYCNEQEDGWSIQLPPREVA